MCSHSSSAGEITKSITYVLYPRIRSLFVLVRRCNHNHLISKKAQLFYDVVDSLKKEFESLSNYEEKLVFPSILKVFNTKDNNSFKPSVDMNELQRLVQGKEHLIKDMVDELDIEADDLGLAPSHAVYKLIHLFRDEYTVEKAKWYAMLNGWNKSCACFINAANYALAEKS